MHHINYTRTELHGDPENRYAPLSIFLYDVPYLNIFYIFPPLHILNQFLGRGSSGGGMSPGAYWEPFSLERKEYEELLPHILNPNLALFQKQARYATFACELDPSFDHIQDYFDWISAVAKKHRDSFFKRQEHYLTNKEDK